MTMIIIVAGSGKLAEAIRTDIGKYIDCVVDIWEHNFQYADISNKVIVHVGSGRQLPDVLAYCRRHAVPLIQGSTGLDDDRNANFTLIHSPNFNILLLKFMHMIERFGKQFENYQIEITESHQEAKTSVPGTAVALAEYLDIDVSAIRSVRNPEKQLNELAIRPEHLDRHAVHVISIKDSDTTISMRTEVLGLASYVSGLAAIVRIVPKLEKRFYDVVELVELNII